MYQYYILDVCELLLGFSEKQLELILYKVKSVHFELIF